MSDGDSVKVAVRVRPFNQVRSPIRPLVCDPLRLHGKAPGP
jgi:hypothetical protein